MRVLCLSAPLAGHLDWGGYLPTAVALAERGHEVTWASGSGVEQSVRAAGLKFAALGESGWRWPPPPPLRPSELPADAPPGAYARLRASRALDQWLEPARVITAADELGALVERLQPDLILSEMFIVAAGLVAERFGLPFVVVGWPAHAAPAAAPKGELPRADGPAADAAQRLGTILVATGLHGVNIDREGPPALRSPLLHVDYWSTEWFAGARLLPHSHHVGGRAPAPLPPDPELPSPDDAPWVFITLGTTFGNDPAFFRMAIEATRRLGALPIVATGGAPLADSPWLRDAIVRPTFDLRALLPHCSAAIHHGGAGTTHALVLSAVPQIVVPHAGDQARQALGVQRTGVGLALRPADVQVESLLRGLAALLPDRAPARAAAMRLRENFAALGGIPRAVDLIERAAALGPAASPSPSHSPRGEE
jgi:UDP:flavonoid glycosyltransferase YjiC (YdhE family)